MADRKVKTKYTGRSVWVNKDTGEIREVDEFEKAVGRQDHFYITYLAEIINLIESLGTQKMKVVKYILEHMSKAENTLIITTQELADKCEVSKKTVIVTLKLLDEAGIIERRTGAIMVSPKLMNNKSARGEANLMIKYTEFSDKEESN